MASSSAERDAVIANLRACLISSPNGIRMESLNHDYMQIIGEQIPFIRLGYSQLEDFLKSVPIINVKGKEGGVVIEAKTTQSSAHVTELVSQQKRNIKKKAKVQRNGARPYRSAPRFNRRPKPPPVNYLEKQCYLPLQISVPQNRNVRTVDLTKVESKPSIINTSSQGSSRTPIADDWNKSYGRKGPSLSSYNSTDKNSPPKPLESLMKQAIDPALCESLLPSTNNFNTLKEGLYKKQINHSARNTSGTPVPVEQPNKKVKQSAQNRLNNIKKQTKLLVSVHLQQGESTSPFQRQLSSYLQERGWNEPAYKVLKDNSGKRIFYCTLSILIPRMAPGLAPEDVECGTFPNEFHDVNEAKECVAKKALEKLRSRECYSSFPIIQDPKLIIQRVELMVKEKETGKWASRIEDEHRTLFKEILPSHWLDVVHASEQFLVEELANSSLLIRAKESTLSPTASGILKLVLPEDDTWDVFVTRAASVTDVFLRFIGDDYSGMLDSLTNDMEMWYQQKEHLTIPSCLVVGEYYASCSNDCWARVVVLKINIHDIHVKFIDHGDEETLPRSVLYTLEPRFMSLPAQAITVSLENLETYKHSKEAPDYLLTNIVGTCLVAVVEQRSPKISVTLFDTSQEEAINLNEQLQILFNYNYKETVSIKEGIHQVNVSYIDDSGNLYLQFINETLSILLQRMDYIEDGTYDKYRIREYNDLENDKIYLLDQIGERHRVKVVKVLQLKGQIVVNLIDSGEEDSVFIEDLYNLEGISYLLTQIPPQAIPARLYEVKPHTFTAEKVSRLKDMLAGEIVVAKIQKVEDGVPIVELFKRTVPENLMASINQTLIIENDLNKVVNNVDRLNLKSAPRNEKSGVSNLLLKISNNFPSNSIERKIAENRPVLPDIGKEFEVLVQQTANPAFIMLQPLDYINKIRTLEKNMGEFYDKLIGDITPFKPEIKEGCMCAVRDKNCWYRAYIDKQIDSQSVSVKLLDYGSMSLVLNTDIKPLKDEFLKIPFAGFCCKIHGIIPKYKDWNMEDCLKTRQLLDHRKLLAQMKGVTFSQTALGGSILELKLFDMNTMTDIGDELVQIGCAKYEDLKQ